MTTTKRIEELTRLVAAELERAQDMHAPLSSCHEAYAVIVEEVEELWDEVKKKREHRDTEHMRREAIQIAAMALRFIHDVLDE